MNRGKKKCEILKSIRCQVAKKNGIPYTYTECTYQGECRGTCPKCEEELRYLTRELEKLKQSGKQVAVAGVAAAVIATSTAGCSSDFLADLGLEKQQQIAGAMPAPAPPEQYVTMGTPAPQLPMFGSVLNELLRGETVKGVYSFWRDEVRSEWGNKLTESGEDYDIFQYQEYRVVVRYDENSYVVSVELDDELETEPPLKGEVTDEYVTAGEPLPMLPAIGDVITDLQQNTEVYMGSFERTAIQVEWADWLTESGGDYDVFTMDGVQIIVTYYEDGWSDSVALYAGITTEDAQ